MAMWIFPKAPPNERGKSPKNRQSAKTDFFGGKKDKGKRKRGKK